MAVDMVQHPNSILAEIRSLQPEDLLVLFTPAVLPAVPPPPGGDAGMDPFEPFGRALSEHHKRIRHVPYVPRDGMTDIHLGFLQKARAVVIVVCNPPNVENIGYEDQRAFAQAVLGQISSNQNIPVVLVLITGNQSQRIEDFSKFEEVQQSDSYTSSALQKISDHILGPEHLQD